MKNNYIIKKRYQHIISKHDKKEFDSFKELYLYLLDNDLLRDDIEVPDYADLNIDNIENFVSGDLTIGILCKEDFKNEI